MFLFGTWGNFSFTSRDNLNKTSTCRNPWRSLQNWEDYLIQCPDKVFSRTVYILRLISFLIFSLHTESDKNYVKFKIKIKYVCKIQCINSFIQSNFAWKSYFCHTHTLYIQAFFLLNYSFFCLFIYIYSFTYWPAKDIHVHLFQFNLALLSHSRGCMQ